MFSMTISVCNTSEYRIRINFDARSDPNVILKKHGLNARKVRLMPVYVFSDVTTGHPESAAKYSNSKSPVTQLKMRNV